MNENLAEFLEIEQILNDQDITIEKMMRNVSDNQVLFIINI